MNNFKKFTPYITLLAFIVLVVFVISQKNAIIENEIENGILPNNSGIQADALEQARNNIPQIQFFSPLKEPLDLKTVNNKEFCFADYFLSVGNDGTYRIDAGGFAYLNINKSKASGKYSFLVGDGWYGTIDGVVGEFDPKTNSRSIEGWTDIMSEGIKNKTKIKIILNGVENKVELKMNLADIMGTGGEQIDVYNAVNCNELKERQSVEQYLRNIEYYHDYFVIDYENNTGYLMTSDHPDDNGKYTQQKKDFTYKTNDKNEVTDLKIN